MSALTPLLHRTSGCSVPRPTVSESRPDRGLAPFGSWKEGCRPPRLGLPDRDSRSGWNGKTRSLWISCRSFRPRRPASRPGSPCRPAHLPAPIGGFARLRRLALPRTP